MESLSDNGHGQNRPATEYTLIGRIGVSSLPTSPTSPQGSQKPSVIPPQHPFRTLVLCFDDQFDSDNTNIVQLFSLLPKDDRYRQMVYYQAGIGTYTTPQIANPPMSKISKFVDEAVAWSLDTHLMAGYEFLIQNYQADDRICIFGFSRGAYIARSLAGMLHKVGLLPASNQQQVPSAYKLYTRTDELGWMQSNTFKEAFSIDVDIEFIGVWDTVNSVGLLSKRLPFSISNTMVRTFRHAVSLDERRAKFKANLWNRPNDEERALGITQKPAEEERARPMKSLQDLMEQRYARARSQPTDVEEVWFAGCHCDVGGGSVDNETSLGRIPLRWMIRECFKTNSGIMFDCDGLRSIGLDPDSLYPFVKPRPPALPLGDRRIKPIPPKSLRKAPDDSKAAAAAAAKNPATEEELDREDALCPVYDQLRLAWFWWILEFLPLKQRYQRGDNEWMTYLGPNLGKGRFIQKQRTNGVKVHRTVRTRLEALTMNGGKYIPKAAFDLERTIWVD
ncbi:hypothetical protein GGX14DRAFT_654041 [Mycena pura]|uniref:T6SS Phospholipase effector Tle1-like catalytic domain-containing protein n=1 Tax=Mycena pura TaxID=153505 RepID=A0AAD6V7W2_9AGAR|nr:hypothetical protein GGX14DRAFT_654041 [Mycena pura]